MTFKVVYTSVDRCRISRTYKQRTAPSLARARQFAQSYVGKFPSFGRNYVVSDDGIGKIQVSGDATLADIFPEAWEAEPKKA
jgi:hypothetical protein